MNAWKIPSISVLAIAFYQEMGQLFMPLVNDINNPNGKWKLPGGGLKYHETLKDSVYRELREETGLSEVGDIFIPTKVLNKSRPGNEHVQRCYVVELLNIDSLNKDPVRDGKELLMAKMFSIEQVYRSIIGKPENGDPEILPQQIPFLEEVIPVIVS